MRLSWEISSDKLAEPMKFSTTVCCQILGRSFIRQTSMLSSLFQNVRIVHSSSTIYTLKLRPAPIKRVGDLWRMNSQHDYVKGEENLSNWSPRGVSLISDFISARKKRRRIAEIGAAQLFLKKIGPPEPKSKPADEETLSDPGFSPTRQGRDDDDDSIHALLNDTPETSRPSTPQPEENGEEGTDGIKEAANESEPSGEPQDADALGIQEAQEPVELPKPEYSDHESLILKKCLKLWSKHPDPVIRILSAENTAPPADGIAPEPTEPPALVSTIVRVPKNLKVLKGGYLLVPNNDSSKWVKRFVELRRPYLHIHNATDGDEVAIVSLRNSRVDSQPEILALFEGHDQPDDEDASSNGDFRPGHRRTPSGRIVSTAWTGSGGNAAGPGLGGLSERLQAGVFAVYGTDNTWLFAARNEREKLDWIFRIDQSYFSGSGSASGSGAVSPMPGTNGYN
ncbi:SPOC domain-containing protein [Apiospora arundinis]